MSARVNDIFTGRETVAELLERGLTAVEADELRAFSEFLRRAGGCGRPDLVAPDPATLRYARGEITGAEYLALLSVEPHRHPSTSSNAAAPRPLRGTPGDFVPSAAPAGEARQTAGPQGEPA